MLSVAKRSLEFLCESGAWNNSHASLTELVHFLSLWNWQINGKEKLFSCGIKINRQFYHILFAIFIIKTNPAEFCQMKVGQDFPWDEQLIWSADSSGQLQTFNGKRAVIKTWLFLNYEDISI